MDEEEKIWTDKIEFDRACNYMKKAMKMTLMCKFTTMSVPKKLDRVKQWLINNQNFHPEIDLYNSDPSKKLKMISLVAEHTAQWYLNTGMAEIEDFIQKNKNERGIGINIEEELWLRELSVDTIPQRGYQKEIFQRAKRDNIVCFMPTGCGKTRVAIVLILHRLQEHLNYRDHCQHNNTTYIRKWIVFLVPTTALATQQLSKIKEAFQDQVRAQRIIGEDGIDYWDEKTWFNIFENNDIFVMTPQCLVNVLQRGFKRISDFNLLVFDECHHVLSKSGKTGHPYFIIMQEYHILKKKNTLELPKVFGLTASPIKTNEKTPEKIFRQINALEAYLHSKIVCVKEYVEELNKVKNEPDMVKLMYVPNCDVPIWNVPLEFQKDDAIKGWVKSIERIVGSMGVYGAYCAMDLLHNRLKREDKIWINKQQKNKLFNEDDESKESEPVSSIIQTQLDAFRKRMHNSSFSKYLDSEKDFYRKYCEKAGPIHQLSMKVHKLITFIQDTLIQNDLMNTDGLEFAVSVSNDDHGREHRGIIFVEERLQCHVLNRILTEEFQGQLTFGTVVGHGVDFLGMSDKKQQRVIREFHRGEIQYLIATQVAEEGLDVPACNVVIRFDLPHTPKEFVQARGRARAKRSQYVLLTNIASTKQEYLINKFINDEQTMQEASEESHPRTSQEPPGVPTISPRREIPSTGAFVHGLTAKQLLCSFCQLKKLDLPQEIYERCDLDFSPGYECRLILHHDFPLEKKEWCVIHEEAKNGMQELYVEVVWQLYQNNELDSHFIPIQIIRKAQKKIETYFSKRPYIIPQRRIPNALNSSFSLNSTSTLFQWYCYAIVTKPNYHNSYFGLITPRPFDINFLKNVEFEMNVEERIDQQILKIFLDQLNTSNMELDTCYKNRPQWQVAKVHLVPIQNNGICEVNAIEHGQLRTFHRKCFQILDYNQSHKLQETEDNCLNRQFLICPLITKKQKRDNPIANTINSEDEIFEIDWTTVKKMNLDPQTVEDWPEEWKKDIYMQEQLTKVIITKDKNTKSHLCMSYGVYDQLTTNNLIPQLFKCRNKKKKSPIDYRQINISLSENNEVSDIKSLDTTPMITTNLNEGYQLEMYYNNNQTTASQKKRKTFEQHYEDLGFKLSPEKQSLFIGRVISPGVHDSLSTQKSQSNPEYIFNTLNLYPSQTIIPTGLSIDLYFNLLNIPSILWRIESLLNTYDLSCELKYSEPYSIHVEPTQLFAALCGRNALTDDNYQLWECLGDTVLKCLTVLQGFLQFPDRLQGELAEWKGLKVSNLCLYEISTQKDINLASYAVLESFSWTRWHPPLFAPRIKSLFVDIKASLKTAADLIESVLGACFYSNVLYNGSDIPLRHSKTNLNRAFNHCFDLLRKWKILDELHVGTEFSKALSISIRSRILDTTHLCNVELRIQCLEQLIGHKFDNPILLFTVIDRYAKFPQSDCRCITFERLEMLGDAILDLVIMWFTFFTMKNDQESPLKKLWKERELSDEGFMSEIRRERVNNIQLAQCATTTYPVTIKGKSTETSISDCILWNDEQQKLNEKHHADVFEAIVGAIFLEENFHSSILQKENESERCWSIQHTLNFIQKYLGWKELAQYHFMEFR